MADRERNLALRIGIRGALGVVGYVLPHGVEALETAAS